MKLLLLCVCFSSPIAFSQNLALLYKDYLPDTVSQSKKYQNQISSAIEAFAEINPELIYYYIKNIESKFDSVSRDVYFSNYSRNIRNHYAQLNTIWINELQEEILKRNGDNEITNFCVNYLEDYLDYDILNEAPPDFDSKTDKNLRDFFVIKYYTRNQTAHYNKNELYKIQRKEIEENKLYYLSNLFNGSGEEQFNNLDSLLTKWHLFANNSDSYKIIDVPNKIINIMEYRYSNKNLFNKLDWGISYAAQRNFMYFAGNSYNTPLYKPSDVKYNYNMNSISLSVQYRMFLSDYLGPFNFITFRTSVGYGHIDLSETGIRYGFWNRNVDGVSNRSEILEFNNNEIKIKDAEYLALSASTPVLYFGRSISIDVGGLIVINNTNYTLTYDYEYRKFESEFAGPKILETQSGSETNKKLTSIDFLGSPELFITYHVYRPYYIQLEFTLYMMSFNFATKI